ncbi:MAG: cysteine desulfurase [Rhizobiales bacterium 62-17]|nr:urate hydroxylase PuuD [Hyphomicrobiales bacterium]OJY05484.1 MAG: cysteine desulfurase [Rhizobiales bacterium 62-17]
MDGIIMEWGGMLLRWVHIITGIAWIGSSFYFMHIDAALRATPEIPKEKGGEAWEVHGGGFYHVRKYLVAPEKLPDELIWHKWESYSTWVSGFFLLVWVYYVSADVYLIDPAVRQISPWLAAAYGMGGLVLGWIVYDQLCRSRIAKSDLALAAVGFAFIILMAFLYQQVFSARGAFIHTGALMATMMTGNVALVIIPNQYKVIDSLIKGEKPDPALGKTGKQRSTHNNYLTLPVLFLMISGHYPLSYSSPHAYVVIGLVLVAGAVVRHFYNERHAGRGNPWWAWLVAALAMWTAIWISMPQTSAGRETLGLSEMKPDTSVAGLPKAPEKVADIVSSRCAMCHAQQPVWPGISIAPKGIRLDHPEFVERYREEIRIFAGMTRAMPPNNLTGMTDEERALIRAWGRTRAAQSD